MSDEELQSYHQAARAEGLRLSEWVRRTLRKARDAAASARIERKLQAIEAASAWKAPTASPERMLSETEAGSAVPDPLDLH